MLLARASEHHLSVLSDQGASPATIKQYRIAERLFCSFLHRAMDLPEPTTAALAVTNLRRFAAWLREEIPTTRYGRAPIARSDDTVRQYLGIIKIWSAFLKRDGWLSRDPLKEFPLPKRRDKPVQAFTVAQVERMAALAASTRDPLRNRALILFLYDTGVRVAELCRLRLDHLTLALDKRTGRAQVLGKGRKERHVYFGVKCREAIRRYLRPSPLEAKQGWGRPDDSREPGVFLSHHGTALSRQAVSEVIKDLGVRAGIEGMRVSPHIFRHTFGVNYIRSGGTVQALMRLLGHSSVKQTMHYSALAEADIENSYISLADELGRRNGREPYDR